jgi:mono/diheme cytochrome c family protein
MLRTLLIVSTLLLLELSAFAQQDQAPATPESPATESIPVDATRKVNPVKPTAESIARGKKLYGYDCAMCHGKDGYGKGDLADDMKLKMADFSTPDVFKGKTDGDLFYIIKNGKGQMPPEEDRGNPNGVWDLVNYVRSFSSKKSSPEATTAPPPASN